MTRLALLALIAGLLAGCGPGAPTPSPSPSVHAITVAIELSGGSNSVSRSSVSSECHGLGGYADMDIGTQFSIKDAAGTLIGFGALTDSHYGPAPFHCSLQGRAENVPDAPIYSVEVGRRGTINFTRAQLEANGWLAQLTLGN